MVQPELFTQNFWFFEERSILVLTSSRFSNPFGFRVLLCLLSARVTVDPLGIKHGTSLLLQQDLALIDKIQARSSNLIAESSHIVAKDPLSNMMVVPFIRIATHISHNSFQTCQQWVALFHDFPACKTCQWT